MQPFQCDLQPRLQETHRTTHTGTTTCCRTQRRNQTTAAASAAHTRYLSSPPAATLHGKTPGFVLRLPPHNKAHAAFMQPSQCDLQPRLQETHRTTHTGTTTCCRTQTRNQTTAAAPAAHTRYLSSPTAATLHGKIQGFVLRLPPHNKAHATFMQPFQCDLQPQLQETHRTTHTGTTTCCRTQTTNQTTAAAPAAHTRYLSSPAAATLNGKTPGFLLRLPPHNTEHATFMEPFHCDLQPQLQETHRTTHTGTTTCCRTQRRNQTTAAASAAHTRYLSSPPAATLHGKHKVSCSGFLPTTKPMQHSCSHSNAICNHGYKKRIELRTQEQPLVTEHRGGTKRPQPQHTRGTAATLHGKTPGFLLRLPPHNKAHATFMQPFHCDLQPQLQETHRTTHTGTTTCCRTQRRNQTTAAASAAHTRYLSSPPAATLHGKHKVSCSGFLPTTKPMQHSCSHSNAICNHGYKKRIELRTQEQPLVAEHRGGTKRPQPHLPHTRGTFHRQLQPLYTEKYKVSCSGFRPTTKPMQHSWSHSNAICNHGYKKRIELRTQEQPLVAEHREGTKRPQPHPPHTQGTFHRRLQPLYTENTRFRAPASSPQHRACNIHGAIPMRSATTATRNA